MHKLHLVIVGVGSTLKNGAMPPQWPKDPPTSASYVKHLCPPRVQWGGIVKETGKKGKPAIFHPDVDVPQLEVLAAVEGDANSEEREIIGANGPNPHIRVFWKKCDFVVGASCGEETNFIYVEWQVVGGVNEVHGRPLTKTQLRAEGAKI